jgi:hypothetical protein
MSLLLALESSFSLDPFQVLVVQTIRDGDHPFVELVVTKFAATNEEDRCAPGVEGVQNPVRIGTREAPPLRA